MELAVPTGDLGRTIRMCKGWTGSASLACCLRRRQFRMTGVVEIAQGITEHGPLTNPEAAYERRF